MELIVASVVGFLSTAAFALGILNLILCRNLLLIQKEHLGLHKEKEALLDALWIERHTHG